MTEYVLYDAGCGVAFGSVAFEREDVLLVDRITPNTCYSPERITAVVVTRKQVLERSTNRYDLQDAMLTANNLMKPQPTQDSIIAAARKRLKERPQ